MPKTEIKTLTPVVLDLPVLGENLSDYTGEQTRIPRLQVPTIRVSYKSEDDDTKVAPKGEFIEYDFETKESKPLGKKISIQILHHRQSLSAYKNEESYYTPEVSMKTKNLSLFVRSKGKDGKSKIQFLMSGDIKSIREAYPDLRYQRSLYVLHDGKLKNLVVYGASFGGYIEFQKELKGQSSSAVHVELTTTKEKTGTVIYYPIVFSAGAKVDMKLAEPTLKQLSDWFGQYDLAVAKQMADRAEEAAVNRGDKNSVYDHEPTKLPPAKDAAITEEEADNLFGEGKRVTPEEAEEHLG